MITGLTGIGGYNHKVSAPAGQSVLQQIADRMQRRAAAPDMDTVHIRPISERDMAGENKTGIYQPGNNRLRAFADISYTIQEPDARLQAEILPPSERAGYTQDDALMDEYMKQFRIEGRIEGDTFIRSSDEPVRLILPDMVSNAELDSFRNELNQRAEDQEIDWQGVRNDLTHMGVSLDNAERLEMKADYLASRYAVLKDRIQNRYTGDEQTAQMEILEQIYAGAKEEMADKYAAQIGGFYEGLGQDGVSEEFRASVSAMVDAKADTYGTYLASERDGIYAGNTQEKWLQNSDAYMASKLRESYASTHSLTLGAGEEGAFSADELAFAGVYAKAMASQLSEAKQIWDTAQDDGALGTFMAQQYRSIQELAFDAGISDKLTNLITDTFKPFMDQFMDSLDSSLDRNQELVNKKPWMNGLVRTQHIDRDSVYRAFQDAL